MKNNKNYKNNKYFYKKNNVASGLPLNKNNIIIKGENIIYF